MHSWLFSYTCVCMCMCVCTRVCVYTDSLFWCHWCRLPPSRLTSALPDSESSPILHVTLDYHSGRLGTPEWMKIGFCQNKHIGSDFQHVCMDLSIDEWTPYTHAYTLKSVWLSLFLYICVYLKLTWSQSGTYVPLSIFMSHKLSPRGWCAAESNRVWPRILVEVWSETCLGKQR